jgi:hypothetical protein
MTSEALITTLSFTEIKFLEAEVDLLTGDMTSAELAMKEGIISSFEQLGYSTTNYIDYVQNASFDGLTDLEQQHDFLLTEKYFALSIAGSSELWNDYRRTGFPSLIDSLGWRIGTSDQLISRYTYPDSEFEANQENVETAIARQGNGTGVWDDVLWVFDD